MPHIYSPRPLISRKAIARVYAGVALLFARSILIQIGLGGDAALLDPDGWRLHAKWVAIFQWLSIALVVLAFLVRRDWSFRALNFVPVLVLFLQYVTIHYAINHTVAWVVGLHAAGGAILFGFLIFLITEWRRRGLSD
jgi:Family of unknown function (DUF6220)